jgi:hypothetical protein
MRNMRACALLLLLVVATSSATASGIHQIAAANGHADVASSRLFTPAPGSRVSQEDRCRIPDRCVDGRGQWICPCTDEAKACGFCGQSY